MKVKELIEALQSQDHEAEVVWVNEHGDDETIQEVWPSRYDGKVCLG